MPFELPACCSGGSGGVALKWVYVFSMSYPIMGVSGSHRGLAVTLGALIRPLRHVFFKLIEEEEEEEKER